MRLAGKSVVITGGTRGLGLAIARRFVAEGASVMCAARNPNDVDALIAEEPHRVAYRKTDVTDPESVAGLMTETADLFGRLDVLVCNAGVSRDGVLAKLPLDAWQDTMSTNLTGAFLCTQAAVGPMAASGGGRVITVSSCTASRVAVGAGAYGVSKAGVEAFTRYAAVELARKGITVNCLAPGYIDEGMGKQVAANERVWEAYRERLLAGRLGTPRELTDAALFLAAEDSSYVNGHVLEVNGGMQWT